MANIIRNRNIRRSVSSPLVLHEPDDNRELNNVVDKVLLSVKSLESTCLTPIRNACTPTNSPSDASITPSETYLTPRSSISFDTFSESTSADFYSLVADSEDLNRTVITPVNSLYETCITASSRLLKKTRLVSERLRPYIRRTELLTKFSTLQHLSVVRAVQINIRGEQNHKSEHCKCADGNYDENCLKSFMAMCVQPAEYRNNQPIMTSTPVITKEVYDQSIFNVARIKKVELHDLTPKVPEFHGMDASSKDRCINNNNLRTLNGNYYSNPPNIYVSSATPIRAKGQHQSNAVTMPAPEDGSVLKKVISFTFDQMNCTDAEKATRPTFVPEKLHFSAYEQFKGQLFVKWVSSSIAKSIEFGEIDSNTVEMMVSQVCTHLIAAGVIKQIVDGDESLLDVFCPYHMYQWTHIESSRQHSRPKNEIIQTAHNQSETELDDCEHNRTLTATPNGREETFASIKDKLLPSEETDKTDCEYNAEQIQNEVNHSDVEIENCMIKDDQSDVTDSTKPLNNDQVARHDCDNSVRKIFIDESTQTELMNETICEIKSVESSNPVPSHAPAPPPPPPPPPMPLNFVPNAVKEKPVNLKSDGGLSLQSSANQSNNSCNTSAILSSASSFCPPPPPPMSGMLGPQPLPLPTGDMWFKSDTLRKAAKHPPKPMINLFWTRILIPKDEEEIAETKAEVVSTNSLGRREKLWQKIDETILENADDFTELFARQATPKRPREVAKLPKKTVIKVLEHKRSQSVGIFSQSLYRHRIDPAVIQRAIYNWDLSNIGFDLLQQMLEHRATNDELIAIKEAQKNVTTSIPLDGPENFLMKFSEISCAPERIACIIFRNEFDEASALIGQKIKIIRNLCGFLMENDHLNDLFAIILTLGNFMNGGNRYRGQADGFGLDVLNKLRDVKSKDKKMTLLLFIVKTYIGKQKQRGLKPKEIIYPVPDAEDVKSASIVDFNILNEQIVQLNKSLDDIKEKMKIVIDSSTQLNVQPFKEISEDFVQKAINEIDCQFQLLQECKTIFRETLDYFKHIPKTGTIDECTPSQFFELWSNFSIDFRDLWKKEITASNAEIIQKYKNIATPKTPQNRAKGKQKPSGLRVRRVNQI